MTAPPAAVVAPRRSASGSAAQLAGAPAPRTSSRHDIQPQPLPRSEFGAVGESGRKVTAFVSAERLPLELKASRSERLEYTFPVSRTLAPGPAGAACRGFADLEVDVLGKTLDELPALRERRPAGEGW